ncbi:MAG: DUF6398 domain-containing protein [Anaerolineae bacterium]
MARRTKSETVPKAMKPRYDEIVARTDAFCEEHLNAEYAQVCRQMAATLARKRPSPLLGGRPKTWAAAIVHAVGSVNFLFDKTQTPHIRTDELAALFGLSKSTVGNKSREIRGILDIGVFDPDWTLPSRIDENPVAWMVSLNGFIIDARTLPRPLQEEAYRKGLIPYLPSSAEDN